MARFCKNCGRPLEEGEVCSCMAGQENVGAYQQDADYSGQNEGGYYQQSQTEGNGGYQQQSQAEGSGYYQQSQAEGNGGYQQQSQAGGNGYYQQGQAGGNGYYQQGQAGGNEYYQQGQAGGNGYYQQGQAGGNGYYQQGQPGGNGYYQQGQPGGNGYYQQPSPEMEWLNNKKNQFVSRTRNMFSEIMPILKAPITHGRELALSGSSAVGIEFIVTKAVALILMTLIVIRVALSSLGAYAQYIDLPYVKIIFVEILFTVGLDLVSALFLSLFTSAFHGKTSISAMINVVGVSTLYQTLSFLLAAIFSLLSITAAAVILCFTIFISVFVEYHLYAVTAENSEDRKLYAYYVKMICLVIVSAILMLLVGTAVAESLAGLLF